MNDKQTLRLEIGKFYCTKDGAKAFVAGKVQGDEVHHKSYWGESPYYGDIFRGTKSSSLGRWSQNGKDASWSSDDDIVAEWVEPKRIRGWVNVYDASARHSALSTIVLMGRTVKVSRFAKDSKEEADFAADVHNNLKRIACIEIDVLEGHGLNGEAA